MAIDSKTAFPSKIPRGILLACLALSVLLANVMYSHASPFNEPWRNKGNALVLDAYELNSIEWQEVVKNKRIAGFISKATDGLSAEYCANNNTLCGAKWRKYAVTKELYHTRRMLAKSLGLKWGAYHLGRDGNPEQQAQHFLQFASPEKDEVIVLDIESMDSTQYMSLKEAERFSSYVYGKLKRYPILYTNHNTAKFIADNRAEYPLLSRLKLWYARYKSDITGIFPMGNWDQPVMWQFVYGGNCGKVSCPYRVKGTPRDIDVNVTWHSVKEIKNEWPFDGLVEEKPLPAVSDPELLLVNNKAEETEQGKHADFVLDVDYEKPAISDQPVAGIVAAQEPVTQKAENLSCGTVVEEMDSDMLEAC